MVLAIGKSRLMNQSVLKEINPEYSLEGLTPRAPALWPPDVNSQLIRKDFDVGKDWRWEKGMTEDERVAQHHWLNGHEFEQTLLMKDYQKRQRDQRSNCQHLLDNQKSKRVPEKHLLLLYWLCQSLWLCGSQQTVETTERDGNTRPPDLPPEKSVCRNLRSNS